MQRGYCGAKVLFLIENVSLPSLNPYFCPLCGQRHKAIEIRQPE